MTLPTGGAWPPPPHGISLGQQNLWSAWYVGDPDGLKAAYAVSDPSFGQYSDFFAYENGKPGSQPAVGLINRVARYFWSRPSLSGNRKAGIHVPLAADIATASADLVFSEPPNFYADQDEGANPKAQERVDEYLNDGEFHSELLEAAEISAALGGCWLRLVWDKAIADHVMIDSVSADNAFGEWRWGVLQAATFFTEWRTGKNELGVLRHLERHEPGRILHGLYLGDGKSLGHAVGLSEHPDTAAYAELVDEQGAIATGVKTLTAAYVANMRPQRRWRKIPAIDNLGRSDYDGVEPLMDALDETYTSWMRDLRLGKARIIVPEFMLDNLGAGKGASWEEDREVYTALKIASPESGQAQITSQQFAIRVAEHEATAKALVDAILRAAGYSPSTLGTPTDAVRTLTATEVNARERESERTRTKKTHYWEQALEPLLTTWLELDALLFGTGAVGEVDLEWPDEAQPDPQALAQTASLLHTAAAASTDTLVRMVNPEWGDEEVAAEVARIQAETGVSVPDLGPITPVGAMEPPPMVVAD